MFTFQVGKDTGDLVFDGQNNIAYVSDKDEQTQTVRLLLSTNVGEWFLNSIFGLAYQYLQVKSPDENRIRSEILKALQQESRVSQVDGLTVLFNRSTRQLTINFNLKMTDGNTIQGSEVINT